MENLEVVFIFRNGNNSEILCLFFSNPAYSKHAFVLTVMDAFFLPIKSLQFDKEQMASLAEANQALKQQVEQMQEEAKK